MAARIRAPRTVIAVAALSALEIVLIAGFMLVDMIQNPELLPLAAGIYGFWFVAGILVVLTALQLLKAKPWARSVLITWHLIVLFGVISLSQQLGWTAIMALAAAVSAAATAMFVTPSARAFIVDNRAENLGI